VLITFGSTNGLTDLLTDKATSWSGLLLHKFIVSRLVKKLTAFYA